MKENGFTLNKAKSRCDPTETITDADYVDDLGLFKQVARGIDLNMNSDKTEFMPFPH